MMPSAVPPHEAGLSPVAVVLAVAAALILALLLAEVLSVLARGGGRRRPLPGHVVRAVRLPLRAFLVVACVGGAVALVTDRPARAFSTTVALLTIGTAAWLLAVLLPAAVDALLRRDRPDAPGHRYARGSAALARGLRRGVLGLVLLLGLAGVLLVLGRTRPAGLLLVVTALVVLAAAAIALTPWLRDAAAGVQLAVTDAVRLDDVLSIDGTWGRVEEVTATYVVLQAWDDRRLVVPARRLTRGTFESWTRRDADLLGSVELDVDVALPVATLRGALLRAVDGNDLWDRRVAVLQVVGSEGDRVRVRATVSAQDPPRLHDLRCDVLEALVEWLRTDGRSAALGMRSRAGEGVAIGSAIGSALGAGARADGPDATARLDPRKSARLFTGSIFAVERSEAFMGAGPGVLDVGDAAAEEPDGAYA